jgi:acyl carrier protein
LNSDAAIFEKLTAIFREIFEDSTLVLTPETTEADIPGWDSFSGASLIAAIEQRFAIRFRTAELQALQNVGNFVEMIRAKLPPPR